MCVCFGHEFKSLFFSRFVLENFCDCVIANVLVSSAESCAFVNVKLTLYQHLLLC